MHHKQRAAADDHGDDGHRQSRAEPEQLICPPEQPEHAALLLDVLHCRREQQPDGHDAGPDQHEASRDEAPPDPGDHDDV